VLDNNNNNNDNNNNMYNSNWITIAPVEGTKHKKNDTTTTTNIVIKSRRGIVPTIRTASLVKLIDRI